MNHRFKYGNDNDCHLHHHGAGLAQIPGPPVHADRRWARAAAFGIFDHGHITGLPDAFVEVEDKIASGRGNIALAAIAVPRLSLAARLYS